MKKKILMIAIMIFGIFFLTGCSGKNNIEEINFSTLRKKLENKDTFILEVVQTGCSACKDFSPRFNQVLGDNNLKAYSVNLTNFSEEEAKEFKKILTISGTPNVIFFNEGEEKSSMTRISGAVTNAKIIEKLKANGYLAD